MIFPFSNFECTPTAVSQSPSKTFKTFLSEIALTAVSLSFIFSRRDLTLLSSLLHCNAIIPWPALGIISSVEKIWETLFSKFKKLNPAKDKMIAS